MPGVSIRHAAGDKEAWREADNRERKLRDRLRSVSGAPVGQQRRIGTIGRAGLAHQLAEGGKPNTF